MTQESVLRIAFDSRDAANDAKAFNVQLEKVQDGGEKASKSVETLGKTASTAGTSVKGLGTHVELSTKALSDQTHVVDKNVLAMKNLAKIVAGYISISKGIEAADGYTQMAARIRNATTSAQEYNLVQDRLLATANTTFRALSEAQEVYLSLAGGMKSLGYSTKQTLDLSDSLSFAFTANATRADQAQSAMDSLSKSMAKGKIDADAWISIVTGADNVIADMAKTTGKTETEIRQLGATGKASLEDLIKTLVATREQNEALANNMENSLKDGLQKLTNETTVFLGKLNETTKLTGHAAAAIGFLSEHIDKLAIVGGIAASIWAGRLAAAFAESAIKAGWSTAAILTQTSAMTASATAAKSLYLAVGGPVGLAVVLAGAAASMLMFSKDTDTATSSLDQQRKSVSDLTEEYQKMSASKLISHIEEINDKIDESEKKINKARRSLVAMVAGNPEFVTAQDIKRQNLMLDQLEKIQKQGKSTSAALQEINNSKLFSKAEIKDTQKLFSIMEESNSELSKNIAMRELANSSLDKASGLYSELIDQSEKLTVENQLLNKSLNDGKESFKFITDSLLQSAANAGLSAGKISQLKQSIDEYNKGALSATALLKEFQKYIPISETDLRAYLQLARNIEANEKSLAKNRNELTQNDASQKAFNKTLNDSKVAGVNSADGLKAISTEAVVTSEKVRNLDSEIQKFIQNSMNNTASNIERLKLYNSGLNKEAADIILKTREASGFIGTDQQLSLGTIAVIGQELLLQNQVKKVEEDRKKLEDDKAQALERQTKAHQEQAVLLAGNDERTRNMLRVYQAFRNAGLGDKQARVMTAQVGRENDFVSSAMFGSHKDRNNGYTNTGFISWQKGRSINLMKSLQGQGVLDKNGNIQQSQEALNAMAKFLMQEVSTIGAYGKTKSALNNDNLSYRELEKIVGKNFIAWDYDGNKLGSKTSAKHLKKQDDYYTKLSKILGQDPDTALGSIKNLSKYEDDAYKARVKTGEEIKQLQAQYDTDAIKRSKARDDEINKATILNQLDLIPKIKQRYDAQDTLASLQFDNELNGYKWTEEQKINYHNETAKLMLDIDGEYSEKGKTALKVSLDAQRDLEISAYRRLQQEKMKEFRSTLEQQTAEYQRMYYDALARYSMPQPAFNRWEAQNAYSDQIGAAWDNKQNAINKADEKDPKTDQYLNEAETRNKMYLKAEQEYQAQLLLIKRKGLLDEEALRTQQYSDNLSVYGSMFGQMGDLVRGYAGESSGAYKMLLTSQKAANLASAIMSGWTSISAAWASAPFPANLPNVAIATSKAGVFQAAIQAVSPVGMAHNGLDNIPKEGTWLLDGGERVLSPRQNQDLTNYLEKRNSLQNQSPMIERQRLEAIGQVRVNQQINIQPKVIINNYSSEKVEESSDLDGNLMINIGKMLDQKIDSGVDRGIQRNLRQGYPLSNAIKGAR